MDVQAKSQIFADISPVFDFELDPSQQALYTGFVRYALTRLLPPDFFFSSDTEGKGEGGEEIAEDFHRLLPVVRWIEWEGMSTGVTPEPLPSLPQKKTGFHLSIFLLTHHRINAVKFFYEMIHRWLLPGKRLNILSFFSTDFRWPQMLEGRLTVSEIVIALTDLADVEAVRELLPSLEMEIRWGLVSVYHANRILEIKGLAADQKTSLIQERIASLLGKRPKIFDSDIFSQMQHFLIMCREEFKSVRQHSQMSRIIYVFYFFRKMLQKKIEISPGVRHLMLKLSFTRLHLPFETKRVLSLFVGINFLSDNEVFERRHLLQVLKGYFPQIAEIEDSYFVSTVREEKLQLIYLEVERGEATEFTLDEVKHLKDRLRDDLKNGVERLMSPLFMPRNEEEVMRNVITLSQQLRYPRDLPQVILSFDEQVDTDLSFTVVCLRILQKNMPSIHELMNRGRTFLKFIPDRIKIVGTLRKKYPKEATVFRVRLPAAVFFRQDHSVDLLKARQKVLEELQRVIGEVRDYNGGMIAKQQEQLVALKALLPEMSKRDESLLENFFHSIFPVELRSVMTPALFKPLFKLLLEAIDEQAEGRDVLKTREEFGVFYGVMSYHDLPMKDKVLQGIAQLGFSSSQLATLSLHAFGTRYLGLIAQTEDRTKREALMRIVKHEER